MARWGSESEHVELGPMHPDGSFSVELAAHGLRAATALVRSHDPAGELRSLAHFFTRLEEEWRGWTGDWTWSTEGEEFALTASHDGSHVTLGAGTELSSFVADLRAELEGALGAKGGRDDDSE